MARIAQDVGSVVCVVQTELEKPTGNLIGSSGLREGSRAAFADLLAHRRERSAAHARRRIVGGHKALAAECDDTIAGDHQLVVHIDETIRRGSNCPLAIDRIVDCAGAAERLPGREREHRPCRVNQTRTLVAGKDRWIESRWDDHK